MTLKIQDAIDKRKFEPYEKVMKANYEAMTFIGYYTNTNGKEVCICVTEAGHAESYEESKLTSTKASKDLPFCIFMYWDPMMEDWIRWTHLPEKCGFKLYEFNPAHTPSVDWIEGKNVSNLPF